jgi:hypothetical protein
VLLNLARHASRFEMKCSRQMLMDKGTRRRQLTPKTKGASVYDLPISGVSRQHAVRWLLPCSREVARELPERGMGSPVHDRGAPSEVVRTTWQIWAVRGYRIYHNNPPARNVST